ncbi:MAG: urease accessory protein UreG [Candidatus Dormibacteraeota bacterium]|nr:urease accessory protein UreG [Candidatus Dormibacteraeota bacterium]
MSPVRIGIGGPVGSGKTLLIERLVPILAARGHSVAVVTNDIYTREDELHVRTALAGVLEGSRIVGVESGACPHTAVRDDPSMNLAALEELESRHPEVAVAFVESGGDNLTLTFSPELVDLYVYVVDVAGGDKIPRKRGPGLIEADLLVINKADLAAHVGADLGVMERDALAVREGRQVRYTDCRRGLGVAGVARWLEAALERPAARPWVQAGGHDHH